MRPTIGSSPTLIGVPGTADELVERVRDASDPPLRGREPLGAAGTDDVAFDRPVHRAECTGATVPCPVDMDGCPCRVHDGRRVVARGPAPMLYSSTKRTAVIDETFDRRRVDPPAGCRAAAEPAILAGWWSGRLLTTEEQLKNNRIAADRSDVWGRPSGQAVSWRPIHDENWQVRLAD